MINDNKLLLTFCGSFICSIIFFFLSSWLTTIFVFDFAGCKSNLFFAILFGFPFGSVLGLYLVNNYFLPVKDFKFKHYFFLFISSVIGCIIALIVVIAMRIQGNIPFVIICLTGVFFSVLTHLFIKKHITKSLTSEQDR